MHGSIASFSVRAAVALLHVCSGTASPHSLYFIFSFKMEYVVLVIKILSFIADFPTHIFLHKSTLWPTHNFFIPAPTPTPTIPPPNRSSSHPPCRSLPTFSPSSHSLIAPSAESPCAPLAPRLSPCSTVCGRSQPARRPELRRRRRGAPHPVSHW
jgi:hypothetical protein